METVYTNIELDIDSDGNPLLEGGYEPIGIEMDATELTVLEGRVPENIDGIYVRNGPNPQFQPRGRYHIFDGDSMLHTAQIQDGKVIYRNRWVETKGLQMDREQGRAIWPGLMERPDRTLPAAWGSDGYLKDASNTDVIPFNGHIVTTFYQCGLPYLVDPITLETKGTIDLEAMGARQMSAHARTDFETGELLFFDYDTKPPFMTYGVLNPDGSKRHFTHIDLPAPRLPHDMAFTSKHTILMDLPLFWDPELMKLDVHKVTFFKDIPSRFGIVPRYGNNDDVQWFEADPTYIYHVINAWEEGDEIVLDVCRMQTPEPSLERLVGGKYASLIAWGTLDALYHRYRFNLKTGKTAEENISQRITEFPTINQYYQGKKNKYSYHVAIAVGEPLRMSAIVRFETDTGADVAWEYDKNVYASEPVFAPAINASSEEDGYVLTFVEDMNNGGQSELHIFDPLKIEEGPVCRVLIPNRMPQGFHACWMPGEMIG